MKLEICNDTRLCDRWSKRHFVVVTVPATVPVLLLLLLLLLSLLTSKWSLLHLSCLECCRKRGYNTGRLTELV